MSQELLYTSAPRGLKPGSRGFCTVLCTQGMPAPLATAVEGLSGYRPIYPTNDERAARNPVVYSHLKMQAAGRTWHVLSRIADYGLDYSQRTNKLAHHVILDNSSEQLPGGPANLLSMPGFMRDEWEGEPKLVALKPIKRVPHGPTGVCQRWKEVTGDAGWAGVVAESFLNDPERLVILLFEPGQEILPLFAEALSLLPPEKRWDVTFSTYFTGLATGTTCVWRALVKDSKEAHESLRFVHALRIDLTVDSLGAASGRGLVDAARVAHRATAPNQSAIAHNAAPPAEAGVASEARNDSLALSSSKHQRTTLPTPPAPRQTISVDGSPPKLTTPPARRPGRPFADVMTEATTSAVQWRWVWVVLGVVLLTLMSVGIATRAGVFTVTYLNGSSPSPVKTIGQHIDHKSMTTSERKPDTTLTAVDSSPTPTASARQVDAPQQNSAEDVEPGRNHSDNAQDRQLNASAQSKSEPSKEHSNAPADKGKAARSNSEAAELAAC